MRTAALEYAQAGIHVFPLQPNGKEPACTRGYLDGTADLDEIEDAWQQLPNANIGIATGRSGLVVVDIDVKHTVDGWDAFDDCLQRFGQLPGPTQMVSTPSGGAHLYFRAPEGVEIPSSNGQLKSGLKTPGLDVRASTGYVVAPPSIIDGKAYHWDITEPANVLPDAWADALQKPKLEPRPRPVLRDPRKVRNYGAKVLSEEADKVAAAQPGTRNNTITKCAFRVGRIADQCGISSGQAEEMFAWAANQWGDATEARKAADSFWRAFEAGHTSRASWSYGTMAKKNVWNEPPEEKPRIVVPGKELRDKQVTAAAQEDERLPRVSLPGAVTALKNEKWSSLCYNSRSEAIVCRHKPPCDTGHTRFPAELTDEDFTSVVCEFRKEGFALGYESAVKAALRVSTMRSFDPVQEYLEGLEWDGIERLSLFLWACFGANVAPDGTPKEREREAKWICTVSKKWPIGAVARAFDPGCQVDTVLIAESPTQGTKKSSAFRALAVREEWFASDLPDIKHKDSVHHLLGPWIIELDELDALNRKEATSIKGFISRRVDRARLSYRKTTSNYPRRVIFCGSTNEDTYHTDATGGRRFWPFRVREPIHVDLIEEWRDQLWAEAVHLCKAGEKWWLDDAELEDIAREEQSKRFKGGVHLETIRDHLDSLEDGETVSIDEILNQLDISTESRNQMHQNEVARALQHCGWARRRVTVKGKRAWRYVKSVLADAGQR